ncbi:hypothetical protein F443_10449, partial [Phytophthora nicotianae P1569]
MRLSAALGALLLQAVPSAAQTTTTTDVYYPTILSAAGNVTGLPGGNEFCGSARVRKPWSALTSDEQALYLEATEMAIANGGVAEFSAIAADSLGQAQGEYSCAFFSWHRRLLLAYESYLRDLDERFACLTLPYYDVHTAYIQAVNGECSNMFECSGIFEAIGGAPNSTDETTLVFDGVNATGYAVSGAPYADSCDDDDNCGYIVRDDLSSKPVPSAASFGSFQSVVASSSDYATFLENIQYGVHNEVLDAVGGAFSTAVAARDVLYYSWYSALDMYLHVFHLCRVGVPVTYEQILESLELFSNATQTCGGVDGVDAESALIMQITVDGEVVDASQHPTLGQYFGYVGSDNWNYVDIQQLGDYSYTYQLPEVLRQQILSNNDVCTGFNRAFAASYTTLNAAAVKSTTTTKTTTKTTTTKTTKIVNGKKVTTTKVTKVVTRSNSTTSSSAKSTVTSGQLVSSYGYTYLGNFSTDNVAYGEGTIVTNGYTGYTPYYTNGEITTKHNGIVSANYSSSSTTTSTSSRVDATYANTSNLVMNVTVGTRSVARNVTASVATSGSYWAWLQTAYNGLYTRFEGNLDLVTTHMKLLECYTFDSVYGLTNFTSTFVTDKNLITSRKECGQRLDLVRSGLLQMAVRSTSYSASSLTFASSTVIRTIRTSYKRVTTRKVTYVRKSYTQKVQSSLESTQQALGNITVTSTSGSGDDETSTTVVDTGYMTSNTTSSTVQSSKNSSAVTTTSSTTTTTTTAANVSETLSEASSGSTDLEVSGSSSTETDSDTGSTSKEGSTVTTTGSNGETTTTTTTGSGGTVKTTTTGSGGSIKTTTTGSGETTTTVTTGSGATTTTTGGSSTTTTGSTTITGTTTTTGSTTTTTGSTTTSGGSTTSTTNSGTSTSTNSGTTTSTTTGGSTTTTTGQKTTSTGSNGETITTTTGSNGGTTTTTTTGSGGSIQTTTTGSGGAIETVTTGSGVTTTTVTTGSGESTTTTGTTSATGSHSTTQTTTESSASGSIDTTTPGATPAATTPGATPAATTPGATPAASKPSATPAATTPSATPAATPAATTPSATPAATTEQSETCTDVSVEGDATYCIEGPICSGAGDLPAGSLCPKKGDVAVQDCHDTLSSYTNSTTCVAPQDAVCLKIKTGAWGCVFENATPAPTTTSADESTPAPTKTNDESTPAPTKTATEAPTPAPTKSETVTEAPTPAPTKSETEAPT